MRELPTGWATIAIRDVAKPGGRGLTDGPFGSNLKTEHYVSTRGPRVIRLQNIGDMAFVGDDEAFITEAHYRTLRKHDVESGDVLIAGMGDVLPRVCLAPPGIAPAIVKADCFRLRCRAGIDSRFVLFALSAPQMKAVASILISGVGRPRMNLGKVGDLVIPLPPTGEQTRIVAAIEEEFSRLDAGMAALGRIRLTLKRLRTAVLVSAVKGQLVDQRSDEPPPADQLTAAGITFSTSADLPDGWVNVRLGDLADTSSGGTPARSNPLNFGGAVPWIKSGELREGLIQSAEETISEQGLGSSSAKIVPRGAILLALYGATVGRAAVLDMDGATTNQAVCAIQPRLKETSTYLFHWLMASRDDLVKMGKGGAQPNISQAIVRSLMVPLPPMEEQSRIVATATEAIRAIARMDLAVHRGFLRSTALRSAILASAYAGRLVPQDPRDEPASVLLERVAADRSSSNRHPPTRPRTGITKLLTRAAI